MSGCEADLSRGSIYNYFPTFDAMLRDMAAHMVIQLNDEQSANFDGLDSPIERICCNIRYSIRRIASDRVGAEVLLRVLPLIGPPTEPNAQACGREHRTGPEATGWSTCRRCRSRSNSAMGL